MNYRMRINLGILDFNVTTDTLDELLEQYEKMKGDPNWLLRTVQETVMRVESGQSAAVTAHPDLDAAETASQDGDVDSWGQGQDDSPWASETTQEPENTDPWDNTPVAPAKPAARRSAPPRGNSGGGGSGAHISTDPWGNKWTTGLPGAPECDGHGLPAAKVKAKSQAGNDYEAWKCALGGPDSDDRSAKCDFFKFAGGNKRK
jgi:hypothetical protein